MRLNQSYADIPTSIGELGLGPWDQKTFISAKSNKIPVNMFETLDINLVIPNCVDYESRNKIIATYTKYKINASEDEIPW